MTKFRVLFLVSLMTAIGGCNYDSYKNLNFDDRKGCATITCLEHIKKEGIPCLNDEDKRVRLNIIHKEIENKIGCFRCEELQRLYCREMLDGLKK